MNTSEILRDMLEPYTEPEAAPTMTPCTFAELAQAHPHLHKPVIDGLLRQGETLNLIAPPKANKSWLIYDLLLSVGTGGVWLDFFQCSPGRVLLVDNELHASTLVHRIPKVAQARYIPDGWQEQIDLLPVRGKGMTLDKLAPIVRNIKSGAYQLIVIDAWYRTIPQGMNENSNADIMSLYNTLDAYAAATGAAIVVVHHASKGNQGDKAVTDTGAGAGAQSRAADCHLVLRQHEEDGCVVLEAAVRSFPPLEPLGLRWSFPVWVPAYGLDTEAVKGRRPRGETRRDELDRAAFRTILDALADGPMSKRDIRRALGGAGQQRADRLLDKLENEGAVVWQPVALNGGVGRIYSLVGGVV